MTNLCILNRWIYCIFWLPFVTDRFNPNNKFPDEICYSNTLTYSDPKVTYSYPNVTYSYPRVTYSDRKATYSDPKAGRQNTREWGIRFPERSGLNHNLAERFRKICEIEKQQTGSCQPDSMIKLAFTYLFAD